MANTQTAPPADPRVARLARVRPRAQPADPSDLVRLPLLRRAFVYPRLSSHEQKRKSVWSIEMQEALVDQAQADGFRSDQIIIDRRDLGISGTKGKEHRPALAEMIAQIEAGAIEAVYVVHISRISRDQTLIDGLEFGELCRRQGIIIVMPTMRLNLRDEMHMRLYRMEIERAADEISLLKQRLGGPKRHKALSGRWDGRGVPLGYTLDLRPGERTLERYVPYEPHAAIVRAIFQGIVAEKTPTRVARALRQQGVVIPDFPPEMAADQSRASIRRSIKPPRVAGGFAVTPSLVRSIATNPVYIGWWLVNGEVIDEENHEPIISADRFWQVQEQFQSANATPRLRSGAVQMLAGLLYCSRHELPRRMTSARIQRALAYGRYQCTAEFDNGQSERVCAVVDARLLDEPVGDVVLNRCAFTDYADGVLAQLQGEYDTSREQARQHRRMLARLEQEIATLKENLAITKTPDQAALLFEMIDQRAAHIHQLADARNSPIGRVLTAAQVTTVRRFLADLRAGWDKQPASLKNELLRILLARVTVRVEAETLHVTISWRSGAEQRIEVERPVGARGGKRRWTDEEKSWLREQYPTATVAQMKERFPDRHQTSVRKMADALRLTRDRTRVQVWGQGVPWSDAENELIRRYVGGDICLRELLAGLPARTWDGITAQRQKLGLPGRVTRVYYRMVGAEPCEDVVSGDHPRTASSRSAGRAAR